MENETMKGSWGGARKGSGRKKEFAGRQFFFSSTPEVEAILEPLGRDRSRFINAAILAYARSLGD